MQWGSRSQAVQWTVGMKIAGSHPLGNAARPITAFAGGRRLVLDRRNTGSARAPRRQGGHASGRSRVGVVRTSMIGLAVLPSGCEPAIFIATVHCTACEPEPHCINRQCVSGIRITIVLRGNARPDTSDHWAVRETAQRICESHAQIGELPCKRIKSQSRTTN